MRNFFLLIFENRRSLVAKYGPNFATNNFGGFGAGAQGQPQPQAPVNRFFRGHGVRLG